MHLEHFLRINTSTEVRTGNLEKKKRLFEFYSRLVQEDVLLKDWRGKQGLPHNKPVSLKVEKIGIR